MGLVSNNSRIFLGVADGKITQSAKEDTPKAVQIVKDGKISYRLVHDAIEGVLTNLAVKENEFQGQKIRSWVLTLADGGDTYQLEVSIKGGYGSSLIKCLANPVIDFAKPIKITPWAKTVNEKKKTAIYVSQADKQVDWYFTKENPNGLPEPTKVKFEGVDKWDWFDQLQFLEKFAEKNIKPKLSSLVQTSAPSEFSEVTDGPDDTFFDEYYKGV